MLYTELPALPLCLNLEFLIQCPSIFCWGKFFGCLGCKKGYKSLTVSFTEFQFFCLQPHPSPLPSEITGTTPPRCSRLLKQGFASWLLSCKQYGSDFPGLPDQLVLPICLLASKTGQTSFNCSSTSYCFLSSWSPLSYRFMSFLIP